MGFLDRMRNSWDLVKASAEFLRDEPRLLAFPLASFFAFLLLVVVFLIPATMVGVFSEAGHEEGGRAAVYVLGFVFYVACYFTAFFFNAALVAVVLMRQQGQPAGLGDGLRIAAARSGAILGYAVIAATVGILLRVLSERMGPLGKIATGVLGFAWGLASFFVVPILVARNIGPTDAIKESAALLRRTWGENIFGTASIGLIFGVFLFALFIVGGSSAGLLMAHDEPGVGIAIAALVVIAVLGLFLVQATLSGIFAASLYRYATTGEGSPHMPAPVLAHAFQPKGT